MPLLRGSKNVSRNIRELSHANKGRKKPRSRKQIIAIAFAASRRRKK
jgi:hypothetical protein